MPISTISNIGENSMLFVQPFGVPNSWQVIAVQDEHGPLESDHLQKEFDALRNKVRAPLATKKGADMLFL